ncbi:zinc finger protein 420-like [Polypterus senegalus]
MVRPSRAWEKSLPPSMASIKGESTHQRPAPIKQEDCEWEDLRVTLERRDGKSSAFKQEDSEEKTTKSKIEDLPVSLEVQTHDAGNIFKGEIGEESWSQYSNSGRVASRQNSTEVKSELSEFEEKIGKGTGRDAEEGQSPGSAGMNFQDNGSFSPSSFPRPSQCRLPHKQDKEKMKKSTRGSENSTPASLQCSLSAAKPTCIEAINMDRVCNTNQESLLAYTECRKCFKNTPDSRDQKSIQMRQKPHPCPECGKLFSNRNSLHKHKRIHTGEKPHSCSECGKHFLERRSLHRHMRIHTGEKPHSCPECDKRFSHISSLQRHTKIHTGDKPHCCAECGKRFSDSYTLQRHTRTHTGEKPYSCSQCDKRFFDICGVQRHTRIHTGERPYSCSKCGKLFFDGSALQKHTRIHTGEKPYHCTECGKRFSQVSSLQSHSEIHSGLKPYCCSECGKRFSCSSYLQKHTRIHT